MKFLVAFSIGPVQEFIAASRRTADLKAGSQLLVETTREIAKFLQREEAELIFPADIRIDPPNKLLSVVQNNPKELVQEAHKVAQDYLSHEWQKACQAVGSLIDTDLANRQINQFLEFYVAWVPLDGDYARARQEVERLLAGRKALRNFEQPSCSLELPKSPLDPARDTVVKLQDGFRVCEAAQRHHLLRLKPRETLDALSLLKRIKGREMSAKVPSTSEMALRSIWSLAQQKAPESVSEMKQIAQQFKVSEISDLFFPGRWDDLDTDQALDEKLVGV
jgi:CRISPR-associated protein Cmr2